MFLVIIQINAELFFLCVQSWQMLIQMIFPHTSVRSVSQDSFSMNRFARKCQITVLIWTQKILIIQEI